MEGRKNPLNLIKGAGAAAVGGLFAVSMATSLAVQGLRTFSEAKRRKSAAPCDVCNGIGFMVCKLCKGDANIRWSPLYDPVVIPLCVCPTCEGNRVQRCLNCLGKGYA